MWADQQQEQQRWAPKRRAPWSNLYRCSETLDFDVIHPLPGNRLVYQVAPALPGREPLVPLFLPVFASRVLRLPWQVPVARGVSWARAGPGTDSQGRTVRARGQWPASNRSAQGRGGGRWRPERGGETGCCRTGRGGGGRRMGAGNETQSAEVGRCGFVTASQDTRILGDFLAIFGPRQAMMGRRRCPRVAVLSRLRPAGHWDDGRSADGGMRRVEKEFPTMAGWRDGGMMDDGDRKRPGWGLCGTSAPPNLLVLGAAQAGMSVVVAVSSGRGSGDVRKLGAPGIPPPGAVTRANFQRL